MFKKFSNTIDDENLERGNWSGKFDFILSCLGYAVGLGNVWRFPYLCYKNGGGAFFIPYFIFLIFVGIPVFLLELALGQYSSQGPLTCWEFAKLFKGIGLAMVFVSGLVAIYYNVIIAWSLWYLFASLRSTLPWSSCGNWSSNFCSTNYKIINETSCKTIGSVNNNLGICLVNNQFYAAINETIAKQNGYGKRSETNDYLNQVSFQLSHANGFDDLGPLRWDMSLCLLLAWILCFLCLIKGIKSSGKVVYFTAIFPYVVLMILFVRGLLTEGYQEGIKFYITPNMTKLREAQVWKDAAAQIFFSLSSAFGGLITLSSYNKFKNNIVRDTLIVSIGNSLTSIFAGFVIFSFLGALAKSLNVNVNEVVDGGVSLAFIVYPQAVIFLPISPLWAILFFLMLITLGLDSEFTMLETVMTSIIDQFKIKKEGKKYVVILICSLGFFASLIMATPGGPYMLTLMDDYAGGWNVLLIGFLECICISFVYGRKRFCNDIESMIGNKICGCLSWKKTKWWWILNWSAITPTLIMVIMIFSMVQFTPSQYGLYIFPKWANALGWAMTMFVVFGIFIPALYLLIHTSGTIKERFKKLTEPTIFWGPALQKYRLEVSNGLDPSIVVDPRSVNGIKNPAFESSL